MAILYIHFYRRKRHFSPKRLKVKVAGKKKRRKMETTFRLIKFKIKKRYFYSLPNFTQREIILVTTSIPVHLPPFPSLSNFTTPIEKLRAIPIISHETREIVIENRPFLSSFDI